MEGAQAQAPHPAAAPTTQAAANQPELTAANQPAIAGTAFMPASTSSTTDDQTSFLEFYKSLLAQLLKQVAAARPAQVLRAPPMNAHVPPAPARRCSAECDFKSCCAISELTLAAPIAGARAGVLQAHRAAAALRGGAPATHAQQRAAASPLARASRASETVQPARLPPPEARAIRGPRSRPKTRPPAAPRNSATREQVAPTTGQKQRRRKPRRTIY